jgi:hypothetical protein
MAKDANGQIYNYPSTDMCNEELLKFSQNNRFTLEARFIALVLLTERMYKQLHLLDKNCSRLF